ncbi:MAG: site-2 protease family protein [Candidatus Competibacteraceae bacterium]
MAAAGAVDGTEYAVTAIPLGGYVRMLDEREGDVDPQERERAFNRQPVSARIAIVAAGPLFNFLFAIAVYTFDVYGWRAGFASVVRATSGKIPQWRRPGS